MSKVCTCTIQIRTDLMISSNLCDLVQKQPQMLVEAPLPQNHNRMIRFL
jgi:hypothetical protein